MAKSLILLASSGCGLLKLSKGTLQFLPHIQYLLVPLNQTAREDACNVQAQLPARHAMLTDELEHALMVESPENTFTEGLHVRGRNAPSQESHFPESRAGAKGCDLLAVALVVLF